MEKQKNNIITINSKNIHAVRKYVQAMKELNRFVKDNMSKWHREQLSIAPIVSDMYVEINELETDLNKFLNCCVNDYIKKDMYFYGDMDSISSYGKRYIHIISGVAGKRFQYEYVSIYKYDNSESIRADASKRITNPNALPDESRAKEFVWRIMDGNLVEISKEKFEEMKQKYITISEIVKNE